MTQKHRTLSTFRYALGVVAAIAACSASAGPAFVDSTGAVRAPSSLPPAPAAPAIAVPSRNHGGGNTGSSGSTDSAGGGAQDVSKAARTGCLVESMGKRASGATLFWTNRSLVEGSVHRSHPLCAATGLDRLAPTAEGARLVVANQLPYARGEAALVCENGSFRVASVTCSSALTPPALTPGVPTPLPEPAEPAPPPGGPVIEPPIDPPQVQPGELMTAPASEPAQRIRLVPLPVPAEPAPPPGGPEMGPPPVDPAESARASARGAAPARVTVVGGASPAKPAQRIRLVPLPVPAEVAPPPKGPETGPPVDPLS